MWQRLRQVVPDASETPPWWSLPSFVDDDHVGLLRQAVPMVVRSDDLVTNHRVAEMTGNTAQWIRKLTITRNWHLIDDAVSRGMPVVVPAKRSPHWRLVRYWKDWAAQHVPDGDEVWDVPPYLLPVLYGWWTTGQENVLDLPLPVGWSGFPPHAAPRYEWSTVDRWRNWTGRVEADRMTPAPSAVRIDGFDRRPRSAA